MATSQLTEEQADRLLDEWAQLGGRLADIPLVLRLAVRAAIYQWRPDLCSSPIEHGGCTRRPNHSGRCAVTSPSFGILHIGGPKAALSRVLTSRPYEEQP